MYERRETRRPWLVVLLVGFLGLDMTVLSLYDLLGKHGAPAAWYYVFGAFGVLECLAVIPMSIWARGVTRRRKETMSSKG